MLKNFEHLFGSQPKKYSAQLDKDDSPELDQTDLMNDEQHTIYQSLIGALQWCVTLGSFNVAVAVMTMSILNALNESMAIYANTQGCYVLLYWNTTM